MPRLETTRRRLLAAAALSGLGRPAGAADAPPKVFAWSRRPYNGVEFRKVEVDLREPPAGPAGQDTVEIKLRGGLSVVVSHTDGSGHASITLERDGRHVEPHLSVIEHDGRGGYPWHGVGRAERVWLYLERDAPAARE